MKRLLAIVLALLISAQCFGAFAATYETYTTAGKLVRQLWAGSGYSGTLLASVQPKEGSHWPSVPDPLRVDVDYLYVRPTDIQPGSYHMDLRWMKEDAQQAEAHLKYQSGTLALKSDLLPGDWYALHVNNGSKQGEALAEGTDAVRSALSATGVPATAAWIIQTLLTANENDALTQVMENYTMRVDLWIEGFRETPVLKKGEDGTSLMEISYKISPAALKAEVKGLILEILSDENTRLALQEAIGEENSAFWLNTANRSGYFAAVDALPLSGDMTITRLIRVREGITDRLTLALPYYDRDGGETMLTYDRNAINETATLVSELRSTAIEISKSEEDGYHLWEGNFSSMPKKEGTSRGLDVDFTLTWDEKETRDEIKQVHYDVQALLSVESRGEKENALWIPKTDIALEAGFVSKELKSAATEMNAKLTVGGEGQGGTLTVSLEGRTRKKWNPDPLPADAKELSMMDSREMLKLTAEGASRIMPLLSSSVGIAPAEGWSRDDVRRIAEEAEKAAKKLEAAPEPAEQTAPEAASASAEQTEPEATSAPAEQTEPETQPIEQAEPTAAAAPDAPEDLEAAALAEEESVIPDPVKDVDEPDQNG